MPFVLQYRFRMGLFLLLFGNGLLNCNLSRAMLQHCPLIINQNNFRNVSFFDDVFIYYIIFYTCVFLH